jgi:hypothetical protein
MKRKLHEHWTFWKCENQKPLWSSESSGKYCRVFNWMSTDISEMCAASIIRVMS